MVVCSPVIILTKQQSQDEAACPGSMKMKRELSESRNVTPILKPGSHASAEVKGAFDKTCRSKTILSAQKANTVYCLKRDSNDCLAKT